ncbi:MAG: Rieske 2Fe-2S domain-containing protein [Actinobacteria bacterium]|nr:Rieske 2Fe-2S domain-containing protein [Actinomycetota bacterium]MSW78043.1 Rieske 2Fe-2S domain-containing protein [Actinomycetota bacterium]MSX53959.1 Rieske 2Fe-2S domain-containing protein [Actinomycetota bacterium]MSX91818.1 Rieske 2Fe-2S domain-containing protein [Actinomycetota bacterium]MSZ83201.1 Rieske 2Fe-2S domain-containing protein [Actinomycetota bacterium]
MNQVPAHMTKPTGWFQIGWANDFPVGSVSARKFFGDELVVFRTESGELKALEAYCQHMGAHLGFGGTVCGELIRCPFHLWDWDGEGQNACIPYQDRPNRAVRMRTWQLLERNDMVYLWHDKQGAPPSWEPPEIFEALGPDVAAAEYHAPHPNGQIRFGALQLSPYVVLDNVADPAHFMAVHGSASIPTVVSAEADGHLFSVKLGFGKRWLSNPEDTSTLDALDIMQVGVGLSYTALGSLTNPFVVIVLATTPIDDETSEMFQTVWLQKTQGDEVPGRLADRMWQATNQLPGDIVIWEHQRYVERAAWAANEVKGFNALRRWAANFYEPAAG